MNPILAALVVIVILQIAALVVAVVARYWVLRSADFELHGIDVARATELVSVYVQGVHDHRFGFPTGIFKVDPARTSPGQVVAREEDVSGSAGFAPIRFGLKLPVAGLVAGMAMAEGADDAGTGCAVGMIGGTIGFMVGAAAAVVVIVPCAFVTVVELLLRYLMRAEIRALIEPVAGDRNSVRVHFELRGPSAFGIEEQLRRGMREPRPRTAPLPPPDPTAAGEPAGFDRLSTLYLSAASVALICSVVAIIVIGNAERSPGGAAVAAYTYEEPETYGGEGFGEEPSAESFGEGPAEEVGGTAEELAREGGGGPAAEAPTPTRFDAASSTFRRYWTLIDDHEYAAAYGVYYHTYATQEDVSRADFVASEHEYLPHIGLHRISISRSSRRPSSPNELWLTVEVPIRDSVGEYAGKCRLFYGDVRMFHADGRWYYRPGEAFGRKPSFGQEGGGIRVLPASSRRCG